MAIRVGIRDLVRNTNILKEHDYVEVEDKKSKKLKGLFISEKLAKEFHEYLEKKSQKEIQEKLDALNSIVEFSKKSNNIFLEGYDKDDPKVLQKVKSMME